MENDLRNEQSDESVGVGYEPKLWHVLSVPKKMEDVVLDAIEAFKAYHNYQPFELITIGIILNVWYRDYEYPARDEKMLSYACDFGIEYMKAQDRHIKNLFHKPKPINQTPDYGC